MQAPEEITELLIDWGKGDQAALAWRETTRVYARKSGARCGADYRSKM